MNYFLFDLNAKLSSFTFSKGKIRISFTGVIYTGQTMRLTCEPPENMNIGKISKAEWKSKGRKIIESDRIKGTTSAVLTVQDVILRDRGESKITEFVNLLAFGALF